MAQRRVRRRVLAFRRWTARLGWTGPQVADYLGIAYRTLQRWEAAWRERRLAGRCQGRPSQRSPLSVRQRLLGLIALLGPGVGAPTLQAMCPEMARREIQAMLRRYRRVWRLRHLLHVLHWHHPGTVWAMDFAEPPRAVDACFPYLLAVRDLASGQQLLWLPVTNETAETAIAALRSLFQEHGPPLVLKSDNGSAFIDRGFGTLLMANEVAHLRSPPETPEYNGSCEAGIGSMKTRTHHQAARHGRPGEWACDDVEAARLQANETARPWGPRQPTPDEGWAQRRPTGAKERTAFAATVRQFEREARRDWGLGEGARLDDKEQAALDRLAITRALLSRGLLTLSPDGGTQP